MALNTPIRSNSTPLSTSIFKSKPVFLHEWWLVKPLDHSNGFALSGIASMGSERMFVSSVIVKVHEPNVVETEDGTVVAFRGFINSTRTSQNGFSSEICQRFSVGFPHNWKKLSARLGDQCDYVDRVNDFDVSNISCHKEATHDTSQEPMEVEGNKKSQPQADVIYTDDLNASFPKRTADVTSHEAKETEDVDNIGSLRMCQPQVSMINNGENGVSSVAATESSQSMMGVFEFDPVLEQSNVKSPLCPKKLKLSSDRKENNKRLKQKIVEDPANSCRRVTRSIAKNSHVMLKKDEKVEAKCFTSPSRRSSRVHNYKK